MVTMITRRAICGAILLLAFGAAACASSRRNAEFTETLQGYARVTGTVTYRNRMILPPDATVRMDLVDISRQGAPALTIGLQETETGGRQVPIPFEIVYRKADIDPTHIYAVQARIRQGERLLFTNRSTYKVITNGAASDIEVVVEEVPGG